MRYDQTFFDYLNAGSQRSAAVVLPRLRGVLDIGSVLDVGCGAGAWLAAWRALGVNELLGLDGDYVDRARLLIPCSDFRPVDLGKPFHCGRRYDLVQCLEVAEHLPATAAAGLVASLVAHGAVVMFSAAPPGQGGDHHVNEQPYEYWRGLFAAHGYVCADYLRPGIAGRAEVEPWYRYNLFVYIDQAMLGGLAKGLRDAVVPAHIGLVDRSPLRYRCRKAVVRRLPVALNTLLAKAKERAVLGWRQACDRRPEQG